ncbi:MAG: hypothetical protein AAGA60_15830 [Cyanobacteria bacterium P01_E01_bin.42]
MSTLAALLERPDLKDKHRVKLERMQGTTLSPVMQFSLTRIAREYKATPSKVPVSTKIENDSREKITCLNLFAVSFHDLLKIANDEEQTIVRAIFQKTKEERQERVREISLHDMKVHHIIDSQDGDRVLSILSKYYEEEENEREPPTVEDWQEFVAEMIEMQLTYFNEIPKPDKPDRLNKFEQLLWEYNFAMRDEDEEEEDKPPPDVPIFSPVTSHQSTNNEQRTTNNQQPTIDKRNAKIDWSQS